MAKQLEQPDLRPTHEEIAQRAYTLFEKKGRVPGHEMENWLEAEAQLTAARKTRPEVRATNNDSARSSSRTALNHRT